MEKHHNPFSLQFARRARVSGAFVKGLAGDKIENCPPLSEIWAIF